MDDSTTGNASIALPLNIKIKRAIFGAFNKMQKNMILGERFFYLSTTMMVVQLLYFPFARRTLMPWPTVVTDHISYVFEVYDYSYLQYEADWAVYLQMGISAIITIATTLGIIGLALDEAKEEKTFSFAIPFIEVFLRLLQTVLLIPSVAIFMKMVICPSSLQVCNTGAAPVIQILGVLLLVVLAIVASVNALFMIRFSRFGENGRVMERYFAAPHGRIELANTWIRGILALTLSSIPKDGSVSIVGQAIWISMLTFSGILLVGMYYRYLPFLKMKWNLFCISGYGIFLWACISLVVCRLINSIDDLTGILLFALVIPLVVYCLIAMTDARIRHIRNDANESLQNAYVAEIRLRLLYIRENEKGIFVFDKSIEEACKEALALHVGSAYLRLYVAELCSNSRRLVFALNLIREAKEVRLSVDQEFFLFCLNKQNMERHGEAAGAASFVTFDAQVTEARESLGLALKTTARFWKLLGRSRFTLDGLVEHGAKIHHQAQVAKANIHKLLNLSKSNTDAIQLYATYVNYILNDTTQANRILERHTTSGASEESGGYAVCTISGNKDSLGKIMEVTQATCSMFGYAKRDMIGRNVNFLIPPPLDRAHDAILQDFLTADADFSSTTRSWYAMHSEGYVFPVDLTITPSTNQNSDLVFIGRFKSKIDPSKHLLVIDRNSNIVTGCSQDAPSILGIELDEIFTMNVHISDIFPDFFSDDQGNSPYYRGMEHETDVNGYTLKAEGKQFDFASNEGAHTQYNVSFGVITFYVVRNTAFDDDDGQIAAADPASDAEEEDNFEETENHCRRGSTEKLPLIAGGKRKPVVRISGKNKYGDGASEGHGPEEENRSVRSAKSGTKSLGKSMATGSVGSSVTDTTELSMSKIHRLITARLKKKDPRMKKFQRFVKYFTIICMCLAIIRVVAVSMWYRAFIVRSDYAQVSFQRNSVLMGLVMLVEQARNVIITVGGETIYRMLPYNTTERLISKLELLTSLHLSLVEDTAGNGGIDEILLYTPTVEQTQNGVVFEKVSFHIGMMQFIRNVENYISTDFEQCLDSCRFILNNGPFALFTQSLYHSYVYIQETMNLANSILAVALFSVIFVAVFLLIAFLVGFVPMFQMTKNRKEVLGNAFRSIPPETMRTLQRRAERRVRIVQSALVITDDLNMNDEDEDVQEDNLTRGFSQDDVGMKRQNSNLSTMFRVTVFSKLLGNKKASKISPNLPRENQRDASMKNVSPDSDDKQKRRVRFREESSCSKMYAFVYNLISVAFIFWVVLIFFVVISVIDFQQIPTIQSTTSALEASGLRETYLDAIQFWLTKDFNNTELGFRSDYNSHLEITKSNFQLAKMYDDALMLGNATMDVKSFKQSSGELYDLYFGNACEAKCELAANDPRNDYIATDLSMVENMKHGLVLAFQRYWEYAQNIIDAKSAMQANTTEETLQVFYESQIPLLNLQLYYSLSDQADVSAAIYNKDLNSLVSSIRSVKIILISVFGIVMIIVYFATLQVFKRMDKELKNSQMLLYMLPLEIFEQVPEMMELIAGNGDGSS